MESQTNGNRYWTLLIIFDIYAVNKQMKFTFCDPHLTSVYLYHLINVILVYFAIFDFIMPKMMLGVYEYNKTKSNRTD